mmetsp:Transcript_24801/g.53679  ORF Transcript_24801/g.53679 Transcript_24801/m.53679 type:complete len:261 (+) Transcript_24801:129-911(+)
MAASETSPGGSDAVLEPVSTLYISNIDWKIKKNVLRRSLHALFSRHGKIIEIVTLRKTGLRGQAWVIFEDVAAATAALAAENGFVFFDRPLKVSYAREKSDRVAKMDGSFVPKDRREKRRKREEACAAASGASPAKQAKVAADGTAVSVAVEDPSSLVAPEAAAAAPPPPPPPPPAAAPPEPEALPSKILFAQDLPPECNEMMLAMLFRQHVGYKEVRIPRAGLAFVEFEDEPHATLALKALNGFKLTTTETLKLTYGKS